MKTLLIIWTIIIYFTPTMMESNTLTKEHSNKETLRLNLLLGRTIMMPLFIMAETLWTKLIMKKMELSSKEFLMKENNNQSKT